MAPLPITKVLNGVVTLSPLADTTYEFVAPNPNTLSTEVLSEVYIHCDTTNFKITINLPSISTLGSYNAKVYVVDTAFNSSVKNITVAANVGSVVPPLVAANTINGEANTVISGDGASIMLAIVSDVQWLALG